jgi:hypothetical protein
MDNSPVIIIVALGLAIAQAVRLWLLAAEPGVTYDLWWASRFYFEFLLFPC